MSRSKTTKRRKLWVNFYGGSNGQPFAHPNSKDAKRTHAVVSDGFRSEAAVPFTEFRPGDVVLSREDVARLRAIAHEHLPQDARTLVLALLRGGR